MRAFVSRWTWAQVALLGLGVVSLTACRGMPGAGFASWGKKDGTSLAASKPSPNFPKSPSASATPNATATASVGGSARTGGSGTSSGLGAGGSTGLTSNPYTNAGGARSGGVAQTGGYSAGGYPSGTNTTAGATGGNADHGFYSATPPGSNISASKWGNDPSGYSAGSTAMQRGGYDYQTADRRNEAGAPAGAAGESGYPSTGYGSTAKSAGAANGYGGASGGYNAATSGYNNPASGYGGTPGAYTNPYATQAGGNSAAPKSAGYAVPGSGSAGHDDDGHGHSHSEADYPATGGYGSPPARSPSYNSSPSSYGSPSGGSGYSAPRGSFSSTGVGTESRGTETSAPAGLSQGNGYLPGSTRRSTAGGSTALTSRESMDPPSAGVRPAAYGADAGDDDAYSSSDAGSGGSFAEPGDSYPSSPATRVGAAPGDNSFDSTYRR